MRFLAAIVLILVCPFSLSALDPGVFSFSVSPFADVPFPVTINGVPGQYHSLGGGAALSADFVLPFAPVLTCGTGLSCSLAPSNYAATNTDALFILASLYGRAGFQFELIPGFTLELCGNGGWSLVTNGNVVGNGPFFGGEAGFSVQFNKVFGLGLFASYGNYWSLTQNGPQYHALSARLAARFAMEPDTGSKLEMKDLRLLPVFPAFSGLYERTPLGEVVLANGGGDAIRDVKVSLFIPRFMAAPRLCASLGDLEPLEDKTVPLYAAFTGAILAGVDAAPAEARITVEYSQRGEKRSKSFSGAVEIKGRNAMTWDDARKAAAFVSSKDPAVAAYAEAAAAAVRSTGGGDINGNLRTAMGVFESLGSGGLSFARDAATPYEEMAGNTTAVDSVKYPYQTLAAKAADRDELSILYCALLESLGIETALITVPGGIFAAFSANVEPDAAREAFSSTDDLLFFGGKTWVPVDTALLPEGFMAAWKSGAERWGGNGKGASAVLYPVREAWKEYPAAAVSSDAAIRSPDADAVRAAYAKALGQYVESVIRTDERRLKDEIARNPGDPAPANRLGVLYARNGLYDKAAAEFDGIIAGTEYAPAVLNRGNVYYMLKDWAGALSMYERALKTAGENATVILSIAKVKYEMKDAAAAKEYHAHLETIDRFLARKYAYIVTEGSGRDAASNELAVRAVWME